MKKINVLIIGNTASTGWNLKNGLNKFKDIGRVDLIFKTHPTTSGHPSKKLLSPKEYDIVHYNYPFIKTYLKYYKYIKNAKTLICHWHGTDLRGKDFKFPKNVFYKITQNLIKKKMFKKADFHFYSTYDLAWWLRSIPYDKKSHMFCLIDTKLFYNYNLKNRRDKITLKKGAKGFSKQKIKHDDMPKILNQYKYADITPAEGLDFRIIQVTHMECLACGLKVKYHEDKNRNWVLKNASISVISKKTYKIYLDLLNNKEN